MPGAACAVEIMHVQALQHALQDLKARTKSGELLLDQQKLEEARYLVAALERLLRDIETNPSNAWGQTVVRTRTALGVAEHTVVQRSVLYREQKGLGGGRVYAKEVKNHSGRACPIATARGRAAGDMDVVLSSQGMPSELRRIALGVVAHDIDFVNCHVKIALQLAKRHDLFLNNLQKYVENRAEVIEEVADFYELAMDCDVFKGYRKERVKSLILRLMYGGALATWERDVGTGRRNNPFALAIARELRTLRDAVFCSDEWSSFVAHVKEQQLSKRRQSEGDSWRTTEEALDRSAFSLVLQTIEHDHLIIACSVFKKLNFRVTSLVYDGFTVVDNGQSAEALEQAMRRAEFHIHKLTGFCTQLSEKPMFGCAWEPVKLLRASHV